MFGGIPTPGSIAADMGTTFFGGIRSYDAKMVQVIIGVVPIIGFAPESFVKIERNQPTFRMITGAYGEITRVMDTNLTGTMTLSLMQTSESNAVLTTLQYADELGKFGVLPILVIDLSGGSAGFSMTGWIQKPPELEFQKGLVSRKWTFDLATVDIINTGNVILGL